MLTKMKMLALAACAMSSTSAFAQNYSFTFTGTSGTTGSGLLTTGSAANGGFVITGITGTLAGSTISGLIPNPSSPNASSIGSFTYDNLLFPTSSLVFDRYGIGFTAGAVQYNIFNSAADGGTPPAGNPYGLLFNPSATEQFGTFTLASVTSAVPEAATWAMMMVGLGVVGGSLRRRRSVSTRVSFA